MEVVGLRWHWSCVILGGAGAVGGEDALARRGRGRHPAADCPAAAGCTSELPVGSEKDRRVGDARV
ncbi:hypothetical protein [Nocardia cyriacigeorgica]|uniref:hypothetical protein n=1 Tax=Nocardia cyriacigeorgica TaxID=135487 RepID=UPI002458D71B|nr:hypothetical protein [Nocardia cyriacigeorgica]